MTADIPTLITRLRGNEHRPQAKLRDEAADALEAQSTELAEIRESESYMLALATELLAERGRIASSAYHLAVVAERDAVRTELAVAWRHKDSALVSLDAARTAIREALAALDDENSSHRGRVYNARAILEGGNS